MEEHYQADQLKPIRVRVLRSFARSRSGTSIQGKHSSVWSEVIGTPRPEEPILITRFRQHFSHCPTPEEMRKFLESECGLSQEQTPTRNESGHETASPVRSAKIVYAFFDAKNSEAFIADLLERYNIIRRKSGDSAAKKWYRKEVLRSLLSVILDRLNLYSMCVRLYRKLRS